MLLLTMNPQAQQAAMANFKAGGAIREVIKCIPTQRIPNAMASTWCSDL